MEAERCRPLIIGITPPHPRPDEAERITALLGAGCDYVHVRFPEADAATVGAVVGAVAPSLRHRLTLHSCFDAPVARCVGGLHLNSRWRELPTDWTGRVSCSCHSVAEIRASYRAYPGLCYATLSPVFDSVSKPGYGPAESLKATIDELATLPECFNVVALGGVTPATLPLLKGSPFAGVAVLGYFAMQPDAAALTQVCKNLKL